MIDHTGKVYNNRKLIKLLPKIPKEERKYQVKCLSCGAVSEMRISHIKKNGCGKCSTNNQGMGDMRGIGKMQLVDFFKAIIEKDERLQNALFDITAKAEKICEHPAMNSQSIKVLRIMQQALEETPKYKHETLDRKFRSNIS